MSDPHVEPPFWLVWDPQSRTPSFRHLHERDAAAEATRLAREHPGHDFYVLEPISVTKRVDVVTQRFQKVPF